MLKSGGNNNDGFTISSIFNNTGVVEIQSGNLRFDQDYTQIAGETRLNGGNLQLGPLASNPIADLQGGIVSGSGNINGGVNNTEAIITPGLNPGEFGNLEIIGSYTETNDSQINIEIGGTEENQFDTIAIDGTGNFDGTLNIDLVGNYIPELEDAFRIIDYNSAPDIEDNLEFTRLVIENSPGLRFEPVYNDDNLTLVVVQDAILSVESAVESVFEGDSGTIEYEFTLVHNGKSDPFTVDFNTVDGTATAADGDYADNSKNPEKLCHR